MKYGMSLNEMALELERRQNAQRDYLVDTRQMVFDATPDKTMLSLVGDSVTTIFNVNEIANNQIGQAFDIPSKYFDRMRRDNPELLAQNVNSWFQKEPKRRMVRSLDDTVRAFVSDRYRRIDNFPIAEAILPILFTMPDVSVESCDITDQKMYIKVVNPRLTAEVTPGDIVQSGIIISNSEVGMGGLSIQPLVYRLVCKNGMVVNDAAMNKRHVGRGNQAMEDFSLYTDETLAADDRALLLKIKDTVRAVAEQVHFDRVVKLMREAKEAKITSTNIPAMVELTGKDFGFTKSEGQGILDYLIRGGDLTLFGMANAVTRAAQDVDSYDRSTTMESIGYDIMNMGRNKWNQLNTVSAIATVV